MSVSPSLLGNQVGVGDIWCLENSAPEAGKLVAVVDLDNVKLLDDAAVQAHLLLLESWQAATSKVNEDEAVELDLVLKVTLIALELVLDRVDVT